MRGLPCVKRFRKTLARERARAERLGDGFSLLALGVNDWRSGRPTLAHLARVLRRRLRMTDEAGWLDERRLGVILPGTPAWAHGPSPTTSAALSPPTSPCRSARSTAIPWTGSVRRKIGAGRLGIRRRTAVRRRPVASMEVFFLQRLPLWKRAMDVVLAGAALILLRR